MVRVGISVEGATEERFVKGVLEPHLYRKGIYISPISLDGNISIDRVRHELGKLIHNFNYITTFYDFYGFKGKEGGETKQTLEAKIHSTVGVELKSKLIPYIQMYEFEGLLFSSPESIATILQDESLNQWATKVLEAFENNPEKINDSTETAPSKRLEKHTPYRKTTHGPNIAREIGLVKMREMCTEFNTWLQQIEALSVNS